MPENTTDPNNHADEAIRLMTLADSVTASAAPVLVLAAQVRATLALVEQQRIANLIALGQYRIRPDQLSTHRTVIYQPPEFVNAEPPLRDDIRKGLGLS